MSGVAVPYHLRTNKFVERHLFLDVLDFVRIWNGPSRYMYVSMGGRYLEDFKLVYERFAFDRMLSIESDATTHKRQLFNRPIGLVECRKQTSGQLIEAFDELLNANEDRRFVVWLDFAEANDRRAQLREFEELTSKLRSGDVCKVTLNANPETHGKKRPDYPLKTQEEFDTILLGWLRGQLSDFLPDQDLRGPDVLRLEPFAALLAKAVGVVVQRAVNEATGLRAVPLTAIRYNDDRHWMLTVTVLVADAVLAGSVRADATFAEFPFRSQEWTTVHTVMVPDLSQRERDHIDTLISGSGTAEEWHGSLAFRLDKSESKSLTLFQNYIDHHRRYPRFGRVQV